MDIPYANTKRRLDEIKKCEGYIDGIEEKIKKLKTSQKEWRDEIKSLKIPMSRQAMVDYIRTTIGLTMNQTYHPELLLVLSAHIFGVHSTEIKKIVEEIMGKEFLVLNLTLDYNFPASYRFTIRKI